MLALSLSLLSIATAHCCMGCSVKAFYDVKELLCFFFFVCVCVVVAVVVVVVVVLRAIIRHLMYCWISSSLSLFFFFVQAAVLLSAA